MEEERKLEIGAGNNPTDGYETLDFNKKCKPTYYGDIRVFVKHELDKSDYSGLGELGEDMFNEIRAVDIVEHVEWIYQIKLFRLFAFWLQDKGELYIESPNIDYILQMYQKGQHSFPVDEHPDITYRSKANHIRWINFKLFSGCSTTDHHYCCYNKTLLKHNLEEAGFKYIKVQADRMLRATCTILKDDTYLDLNFKDKLYNLFKKSS